MARGGFWAAMLTAAALVGPAAAEDAKPAPKSLAETVRGLTLTPGLIPVYTDAKGGKVFLAFSDDGHGDLGQYLYQVDMRSGLGSTPVGIDRNNPGATNIIAFRRVGPKVVAELQNYGFRAEKGGANERQAVRESFPPSIVWSGDVAAEDGAVVLVDITSFLVRDAFGVIDALKDAKQGDFKLAAERSYPDVSEAHAFPDNLEFEAHETFVSDAPGDEVKAIAPEPHAVTLIEHQSLIKLPGPGYIPRLADARTGAINTLVTDYGAPLGLPLVYRLAERFRLEKTDPAAARSPVKKPIVFYVDNAAPEPVRSALVQGARWWADAFDAAGFENAFKVEVLPEGASPLDARYNVINWVHRQTRGWSYGYPIIDPRTGEIVKGSVLLGSQRVRQDRLIFEALVGADKTGSGAPDDPIVISLARLRQLAIHETGHAIGLLHNFAASTYDDRASAMDYPAPRIGIVGDRLDFSDAYKVGVGSWDRFAIKWLYSEVPPGAAGQAALEKIIDDAYAAGARYVRDEDARSIGSAQPDGAIWDDGPDTIASLAHVLEVRRIALARFGPANIPAGAPLSDLRRVIVPIYLFHRYQVDAAAKSVGGVDFTYAMRGDGLHPARPVEAARQRQALIAVLATLDPAVLDLPDVLIDQLSQGLDGVSDRQYDTELFSPSDTPVFDLDAAAGAAADVALGDLLEPSRLQRVAGQGERDAGQLTLSELLDQTIAAVFPDRPDTGRRAGLRRVVQSRLVVQLARTAEDKHATPAVAGQVRAALDHIAARLSALKSGDPADLAQARYLAEIIQNRSYDRLANLVGSEERRGAVIPPGMPIGAGDGEMCWFCEPLPRLRAADAGR